MVEHYRCKPCSINFLSQQSLHAHNALRHPSELGCGELLLEQDQEGKFKCPTHGCTWTSQCHDQMKHHLRRRHDSANSARSTPKISRKSRPVVSSANQDAHQHADDEYPTLDIDCDCDEIIPDSESDVDMIVDDLNGQEDSNSRNHSSSTHPHQPTAFSSDQHPSSNACVVPPHLITPGSITVTAPNTVAPAMVGEHHTSSELCPTYIMEDIANTPNRRHRRWRYRPSEILYA